MAREIFANNKIIVTELGEDEGMQGNFTGWRTAEVKLSSLTFGIANRRVWDFVVYYDGNYANFNCEQPPVADYKGTPRSAWHKKELPTDEMEIKWDSASQSVIDRMPCGYDYEMLKEYLPEFAVLPYDKPFYRMAWDAVCRPINDDAIYYIHPEENRTLHGSELCALAGMGLDDHNWLDIPEVIKQFMLRQVDFFIQQVWGDDDFGGFYDPGLGWREEDATGEKEKRFNYALLEPELIHLISRKARGEVDV